MLDGYIYYVSILFLILFTVITLLTVFKLKYSVKKTFLLLMPIVIVVYVFSFILGYKYKIIIDHHNFLYIIFLPIAILFRFLSTNRKIDAITAYINSYISIFILLLTASAFYSVYKNTHLYLFIFTLGMPLTIIYLQYFYKKVHYGISNINTKLLRILSLYSLIIFIEIQIYSLLIGGVSQTHVLRIEIFGVAVLSVYILSIIFFYFITLYVNKRMIEINNELWFKEKTEYTIEHFKQIEQKNKSLRILSHDLRHILTTTSKLIQDNKNNEALEFINQYVTVLEKTRVVKFCEDTLINSTIEYFYELCMKNNIKFNCKINKIEDILPENPHEIAIIISNCLENAYNASLKLDANNRVINFTFLNNDGRLGLKIKNNYNGIIIYDEDNKPTNIDYDHGLGSVSIKFLAKKNNLIVDYEITDTTFEIKILFKKIKE